MSEYCSVHPLIDMYDLSKEKAVMCMIDGNRGGGKTVAAKDFVLQNFINKKRKFIWLTRWGIQLPNVALSFLEDLQNITTDRHFAQYNEYHMSERCVTKDTCYELKLNNDVCGYSLSLNSADNIKRLSSLFVTCDWIVFDEFQPISCRYIENEVELLINIYNSIARGDGQHVRNVRILMMANSISLCNPYYYELDIAKRIRKDTKYLRGNGWILYRYMNQEAAHDIKTKGIAKVFGSDNKMIENSAGDQYYIDDSKFIEKPSNPGRIVYGLRYKDKVYGIWNHEYYYYVSHKFDPSVKVKLACTLEDHDENWMYIQYKSEVYYKKMMNLYTNGCMRFQDLDCKSALFKFFRY